MDEPLIEALRDPAVYDHPVEEIRIVETHISWIILTGPYAYKIKKPLDLGFLDFRELEQRHHFCEEELRLNRRTAESIYLEVLPITGSTEAPVFGGEGSPFEYALRMRQFDPDQTLDRLCEKEQLTSSQMDELADLIADFHSAAAPFQSDEPLVDPENVRAPMLENFPQIRKHLTDRHQLIQLEHLEAWTTSTLDRLTPLLEQRAEQGHIRECHGDLHLGNIAWFENRITVFDCIEFNQGFRCIDTACDLAFLLMDLEQRGRAPFSFRILNRYLEHTGDYGALQLLPLYKAYRALIRAKISLLSPAQTEQQQAEQMAQYQSYADLAERYTAIPQPWLIITTGFSASGKSHVSQQLAEALGMIRIRSDVERKRLFGLGPHDRSDSALDAGIYTPKATTQTYERLARLTREILGAGYPVIADSAALRRDERHQLAAVAEALAMPSMILSCEAPEATLRERIRERAKRTGEASEATEPVLDRQLASAEPLDEEERQHSVHVRTDDPQAVPSLIRTIEQHFV